MNNVAHIAGHGKQNINFLRTVNFNYSRSLSLRVTFYVLILQEALLALTLVIFIVLNFELKIKVMKPTF